MAALADFPLEVFFSRWEFAARHNLTASDAETLRVGELLELAGPDDLAAWEALDLGYRPTWGDPGLREAIAATYAEVSSDDVLGFAGAQEGIVCALRTLLRPADHVIVVTPGYQAAELLARSICEVSGVALDERRGFALDVAAIEAAVRPAPA